MFSGAAEWVVLVVVLLGPVVLSLSADAHHIAAVDGDLSGTAAVAAADPRAGLIRSTVNETIIDDDLASIPVSGFFALPHKGPATANSGTQNADSHDIRVGPADIDSAAALPLAVRSAGIISAAAADPRTPVFRNSHDSSAGDLNPSH